MKATLLTFLSLLTLSTPYLLPPPSSPLRLPSSHLTRPSALRSSPDPDATSSAADEGVVSPLVREAEAAMAEADRRNIELKAQEKFMSRDTGVWKCGTCAYEYKEKDGDTDMIGGTNAPGTKFETFPLDYRCPSCRSSRDTFFQVTEEIPGFEVNQGYGFGTNAMTGGQKSGLVFGGLAVFFLLFLGGYGMN